MTTPTDWLRAAIIHRRRLAESAITETGPAWDVEASQYSFSPSSIQVTDRHGDGETTAILLGNDTAALDHVALNDPQDAIARCQAELAILELHQYRPWPQRLGRGADCSACGEPVTRTQPCRTVELIARGYRDQPGYADHWRT